MKSHAVFVLDTLPCAIQTCGSGLIYSYLYLATFVPFIYCAAVFTPLSLLSEELVVLSSALKYIN